MLRDRRFLIAGVFLVLIAILVTVVVWALLQSTFTKQTTQKQLLDADLVDTEILLP